MQKSEPLPETRFKSCTSCDRWWADRNEFLEDPDIQPVGYQYFEQEKKYGFFLFNHLRCGTTLALDVALFRDLHEGPDVFGQLRETDECPGLCLDENNLDRCPAPCKGAVAREILQKVRVWPKA